MPSIIKNLRTKQVAIIGTSIILALTAVTLWNWNSKKKAETPSDSKERSVKHKKSTKDTSSEVNNQDQNQSQIEKQEKPVVVVEEEKVVIVVEEKEKEAAESHFDELSSTKSHCLSPATSSADESDICTPKHESNTTACKMEVKETTTMADTQEKEEKEQVKFDWTDETVTEALPAMNRDIVASVESIESSAVKDDFIVVDYPAAAPIVESTSVSEPVADSVVDLVTEPVAEPAIESITESSSLPVTESATEPVAEKRPLSSSLTASAPEFVPKSLQPQQPQQKRSTKKFLTREQLIEQQRQHHMPRSKARCSHWPHCTNNNCKFFHPYRTCRAGDDCLFGDRCMFVHPNDCTVTVRDNHHNNSSNSNNSNSDSNNTTPSITAE